MCSMLLSGLVNDIIDLPVMKVIDDEIISPEVLIRTSDGSLHRINYLCAQGNSRLIIDVSRHK